MTQRVKEISTLDEVEEGEEEEQIREEQADTEREGERDADPPQIGAMPESIDAARDKHGPRQDEEKRGEDLHAPARVFSPKQDRNIRKEEDQARQQQDHHRVPRERVTHR